MRTPRQIVVTCQKHPVHSFLLPETLTPSPYLLLHHAETDKCSWNRRGEEREEGKKNRKNEREVWNAANSYSSLILFQVRGIVSRPANWEYPDPSSSSFWVTWLHLCHFGRNLVLGIYLVNSQLNDHPSQRHCYITEKLCQMYNDNFLQNALEKRTNICLVGWPSFQVSL